MNERLAELFAKQDALIKDWIKYPVLSKEYSKALNKLSRFSTTHRKEVNDLIIAENKAKGVYWDREDWIYDVVKTIKQHYELTGQERTRKFVEDLEKINGCVITENDAGYTLEIFTPYKVYIYGFNRGYGDYPITIHRGFIASNGNTYVNNIFLAESTRDMKNRYHEGRCWW